jgi:hypothetical protein
MTTLTESELNRLKAAVGEIVRRGVGYDDWMDECVSRLTAVGEDPSTATAICSKMWQDACEEDQAVKP